MALHPLWFPRKLCQLTLSPMANKENDVTEPDDNAWFRPHRWGYGVGMPIAWQGWLLMAGQIALAGWGVVHFGGNEEAQLAIVLLAILVPFPVMVAKTRGGWGWRWGERD